MKSLYHIFKNTKRRIKFERHIIRRRIKQEKVILQLYSQEEIKQNRSKRFSKLVPFIIGQNKPTVIVCPGGAYQFISMNNEGADYAKAFNERGYNVFMLNYRTGAHARFPAPMEDLARAIQFAKSCSKDYNIDMENFYICGSSAGGHLAAYFGARYTDFEKPYKNILYPLRPKGIILAYPVISMKDETHELSRDLLLGLGSGENEKLDKSVELIADENYPPVFFWHCDDDKTVPVSNSIRFAERLLQVNATHKFMKFSSGGHGIGLGNGTSAEGWIDEACKFIEENCQ